MKNRLSVFLLTRALDMGGAQRQLVELAKGLAVQGHAVTVGVFYPGGALELELAGSGVEVVNLAKKGRWDVLAFMARLVRELRRSRPDIIYTFLSNANTIGLAASWFARRIPVIWSVRASDMQLSHYESLSRWSYKLECWLSRWADAIIANSQAGATFAIRNGFPARKITVVPNGIDTIRFRRDADIRAAQRRKFGFADGTIAVGVLARLDPMKGHGVFLEAISKVAPAVPNARFLCIGEGPELAQLRRRAEELGVAGIVSFPGQQDANAALNALDVACSCSVSEGFSNAIAEALACGLPCVVTDVGDSAIVVGESGEIVRAGSAPALAKGIEAQIRAIPLHDSAAARERIVNNFSIPAMVIATLKVFCSVLVDI